MALRSSLDIFRRIKKRPHHDVLREGLILTESKQCDIARKKTTLQHIKKRPQHDVL